MLVVKGKYGWSTPCKSKLNNEEITYWLSVGFGKGREPQNEKMYMDVKEFFMSCYKKNDGSVAPKMVVMDWSYSQRVEKDAEGNKYVANDTPNLSVAPDDLPFY